MTKCTECNYGYYLDGESCIKCPHPCKHCYGPDRCIDCVDGTNRQIPPTCSCKNYFYDDGVNGDCVACPAPGGICTSPTEYTVCAVAYYWGDKETGTKEVVNLVTPRIEKKIC